MTETKKKAKKKLPKFLSEEEIDSLKEIPFQDEVIAKRQLRETKKAGSQWIKRLRNKVFNARRDQAILALFYSSGIRIAELVNIDVEDLDMKRSVVKILSKGGDERQGELTNEAIKSLNKYLKARRFWKGNSSQALFLNRTGDRIQTRDIQRRIEGYGMRAGIKEKVTPHQLRHSIATHLLDSDMDIRRIQAFLGHKSLASTQIYTGIRTKKQRQEFERHHPDYRK